MRFGIFADVHANYPALYSTIELLKSQNCVKLLCLGDVVDYGPHPEECISLLRRERIPCILGNHDEWIFNDKVLLGARDSVQQTVAWTRANVTAESRTWLRKLPRELNYAGLQLVHAANGPPGFWPYVKDKKTLTYNFEHQQQAISFNGHTHIPAIGVQMPDKPPDFLPLLADHIELPRGGKVLVNPGSVGQPRDGDPRAACLIYETRDNTVTFLRTDYDIEWVIRDITAVGLPEHNGERLRDGR